MSTTKTKFVVLSRVIEVTVDQHATEGEIIDQAQAEVQTEIDNGTFAFNSTEVKHSEPVTA